MTHLSQNCFAHITVPVVDLRSEPTKDPLIIRGHDRRRQTQLLQDTCVHIVKVADGWCEVEVPEQMMGHCRGEARPYRGFVPEECLIHQSGCTCRRSHLPCWSKEIEVHLCQYIRQYLHHPYLWGGMSVYNSSERNAHTGFDCSGIVFLAYQDVGMFLPRDAIDQCAVGNAISPSSLRGGDLIFTAPKDGKVGHVQLWSGSTLLEATVWGEGTVQESAFETRFGFPLSRIQDDGAVVGDLQFFFRRLLV